MSTLEQCPEEAVGNPEVVVSEKQPRPIKPVTGEKPFSQTDITALDAQLENMDRSKVAGFLDSFYAKLQNTTRDPRTLELAADLLKKWGERIRQDFTPHTSKISHIASEERAREDAEAVARVNAVRGDVRNRVLEVLSTRQSDPTAEFLARLKVIQDRMPRISVEQGGFSGRAEVGWPYAEKGGFSGKKID